MKRKIPYFLALLILLGVMTLAGYKVLTILGEYRTEEDTSQELQQFIQLPPAESPQPEPFVPDATEPEPVPGETEPEPTEDPTVYPEVDFASLQEINPDVIGWIYIEDTKINYPIVQGVDNSRYMHTMADGRRNAAGSIFMDFRNEPDFSERHTILYGHNMRNGAMFAGIRNYMDPEFAAEHPIGLIMTPEKNFRFEVIGGYIAKTTDPAWRIHYDSDEDFAAWLRDTLDRSTVECDAAPQEGDRILTLSTCTYEIKNGRFVLICRILP